MTQEDFWKHRWAALVWVTLLGFVLSCNYTNHGPLVPTLVQILGITLGAAGFFTTAVFFTHAVMQMPGGAMSDKFGAKRVGTFGLIVIAIGNILTGMSSTYEQILLFKFITGIGTGSAIQAGLRYVPTFFAGKEIALSQGIYGGSILLGSGFVVYIIPRLLGLFSWQGIFFLTGTMAAVLAVLWVIFAPATPVVTKTKKIDWGTLLSTRNLWVFTLAQVASFGTVTACGTWINVALQRNIHLDPKTAGMVGALVLIIGILGRPLGGLILDHKWLTTKQLLIIANIGLGLGFAWVGNAETVDMAVVAILITGILAGIPFGPIFAGAAASMPTNPGVAMGFVNTFGAATVMILPPIMGNLVDQSGTFLSAFYLLGAVAVVGGFSAFALKNAPKGNEA